MPEVIETIHRATGVPMATVEYTARYLREADMLPKGRRGSRGSARMTADHMARFVLSLAAVLTGAPVKQAPQIADPVAGLTAGAAYVRDTHADQWRPTTPLPAAVEGLSSLVAGLIETAAEDNASPYDWARVGVTVSRRPDRYTGLVALAIRGGGEFRIEFGNLEPGLFLDEAHPAPVEVGATFPGILFMMLGKLLAPENELSLRNPSNAAAETEPYPRDEDGPDASAPEPNSRDVAPPRANAVCASTQAEYALSVFGRQGSAKSLGAASSLQPTPSRGKRSV